jgi:hypothetical protein
MKMEVQVVDKETSIESRIFLETRVQTINTKALANPSVTTKEISTVNRTTQAYHENTSPKVNQENTKNKIKRIELQGYRIIILITRVITLTNQFINIALYKNNLLLTFRRISLPIQLDLKIEVIFRITIQEVSSKNLVNKQCQRRRSTDDGLICLPCDNIVQNFKGIFFWFLQLLLGQ